MLDFNVNKFQGHLGDISAQIMYSSLKLDGLEEKAEMIAKMPVFKIDSHGEFDLNYMIKQFETEANQTMEAIKAVELSSPELFESFELRYKSIMNIFRSNVLPLQNHSGEHEIQVLMKVSDLVTDAIKTVKNLYINSTIQISSNKKLYGDIFDFVEKANTSIDKLEKNAELLTEIVVSISEKVQVHPQFMTLVNEMEADADNAMRSIQDLNQSSIELSESFVSRYRTIIDNIYGTLLEVDSFLKDKLPIKHYAQGPHYGQEKQIVGDNVYYKKQDPIGIPKKTVRRVIEIQDNKNIPKINNYPVIQKINRTLPKIPVDRKYNSIRLDNQGKLATVTKINEQGRLVEKTYILGLMLGKGAYGAAFDLIPQDGLGKHKVLKIAHKDKIVEASAALQKGKSFVDKQFVHPFTGVKQKHIPGILNLKQIEPSKGLALSKYCSGSMFSKIKANESFDFYARFIAQSAFAINHLHTESRFKPGVVHHDLKPENMLYHENNGNPNFYVIDFDGSSEMNIPNNTLVSTDGYLSEKDLNTWKNNHTNKKLLASMDVRALGLSWLEILTGRQFTQEKQQPNLTTDFVINAVRSKRKFTQNQIGQMDKICELIVRMTRADWPKRPTMNECIVDLQKIGLKMPQYEI